MRSRDYSSSGYRQVIKKTRADLETKERNLTRKLPVPVYN